MDVNVISIQVQKFTHRININYNTNRPVTTVTVTVYHYWCPIARLVKKSAKKILNTWALGYINKSNLSPAVYLRGVKVLFSSVFQAGIIFRALRRGAIQTFDVGSTAFLQSTVTSKLFLLPSLLFACLLLKA